MKPFTTGERQREGGEGREYRGKRGNSSALSSAIPWLDLEVGVGLNNNNDNNNDNDNHNHNHNHNHNNHNNKNKKNKNNDNFLTSKKALAQSIQLNLH